MKRLLALTLLFSACGKKPPSPPPQTPPRDDKPVETKAGETRHEAAGKKLEFVLPEGWTVHGKDRTPEEGVTFSRSDPQIEGALRLVKRPAALDRKAWDLNPKRFSSQIDNAGIADKSPAIDGRKAYRVQYRYKEVGRGATDRYEWWAVEISIERDADSSFEAWFKFLDKHSEAAFPVVDRFVESLRIRE